MTDSRLCGTASACLLLILCVLSCGCGDYVPNHDVIVIRLNQDGTTAWTRTLDTGFDDVAGDIVETPTGDLVIAGGNASQRYGSPVPKLTRLAGNGTPLADEPCPAISGEFTAMILTRDGTLAASTYDGDVGLFDSEGRFSSAAATGLTGVWALAPVPDGSIIVAGQSWEQYPAGSVPEYDANGTLSPRAPQAGDAVVTPGCHETILTAGDRKIPVTECVAPVMTTDQAMIVILDRNGTILKKRGYGAYGIGTFWSVAPAGDSAGFYLGAFGKASGSDGFFGTRRSAVYIRSDGTPGWITDLGTANQYFPSVWDVRAGGLRLIVPEEYSIGDNSTSIRPVAVDLGPGGQVTGRTVLNASRLIVPTADGGYFSAGVPITTGAFGYYDGLSGSDPRNELHAKKLTATGAVEWDQVVLTKMNGMIKRVIQTSDGGYVILAMRENG